MTQPADGIFLPSAEEIEREAALWFARIIRTHDGDTTEIRIDDYAAGDAAFKAWLDAATGHRVALLRLFSVWQRTERLRSSAPKPDGVREKLMRLPASAGRAWVAVAASILIAITLVGVAYQWERTPSLVYQTARGGQQLVPLPDGSRINLNSDTRLDAELAAHGRTIILERGEAFFEVSRDEKRPFRIYAGDEVITVLGTKFAVRRLDQGVEVSVTEGRVQVECRTPNCRTHSRISMTAGEAARTDAGEIRVTQKGVDAIIRKLSWRHGFIDFDQATLQEAATEFNRYNHTELVIQDSEIGQIPVSGKFRTDNLDAFVRFLTEGFGFHVAAKDNKILVSR